MWIAAFTCHSRLPILSNDSHFDLVPNLTRIPF
jgi:predicted nucleic acid-binding protein